MTKRKPKPLFKWESKMFEEPIYVLQAYNFRISIERAKEIYEVTARKFADRILALFTEEYLTEHTDGSVVAATCAETYAFIDNVPENERETTFEYLNIYIQTFGHPDMLQAHGEAIKAIAADMKNSVSGKRAVYELSYLTHITKCLCMNDFSARQKAKRGS